MTGAEAGEPMSTDAAAHTDAGAGGSDTTVLSGHDVEQELLGDWRVMFDGLHARFATGDFATGLALVDKIGAAAEEANHHPDIDLTYGAVEVHLSSHDVGGVTQRDIRLARQISDVAGQVSARPEPQDVTVLELALDTPDAAAIAPFWAALLGYPRVGEDDEVDELADRTGRNPTIWFQSVDSSAEFEKEPHQRFHLDVRVPPEVAEKRVKDALEAGGSLVSDARAPAFWVLADAQGNKACVTTWLGRD